jgi:hypothetical protein
MVVAHVSAETSERSTNRQLGVSAETSERPTSGRLGVSAETHPVAGLARNPIVISAFVT